MSLVVLLVKAGFLIISLMSIWDRFELHVFSMYITSTVYLKIIMKNSRQFRITNGENDEKML